VVFYLNILATASGALPRLLFVCLFVCIKDSLLRTSFALRLLS